ncbi:MAG: hypothetical protein ABIQ32_05420 [Sphingomicrobium sp.]
MITPLLPNKPRGVARVGHHVERVFSKFKHFGRIATRYDKLASLRLWVRAYESTA